jgi:hypothetical protein
VYQRKWDKLVDQIEKLFGLIEHTNEEFPERRLEVETVVFDGASGRMKLERSVTPLVIDRVSRYSKRIGGEVDVEYVYSDDEFVDTVKLYRWVRLAGEWEEMDISELGH